MAKTVAVSTTRADPLPWPTSAPLPRSLHVEARDSGTAMTITVSSTSASAVARLDLQTHETVLRRSPALDPTQLTTTQHILRLVIDRQRYEQRAHGRRASTISFDLQDPRSWTPMQMLAAMNNAWWYPPFTNLASSRSSPAWEDVRAAPRYFRSAFFANLRALSTSLDDSD